MKPKRTKQYMRSLECNGYTYRGFWDKMYRFTKPFHSQFLLISMSDKNVNDEDAMYMLRNNISKLFQRDS